MIKSVCTHKVEEVIENNMPQEKLLHLQNTEESYVSNSQL